MKEEKPQYGWYVRDLIIGFTIAGLIGLTAFIFGLLLNGILGIVLIITGIILIFLFLWPGIGMIILNLSIADVFYLDKRIKDVYKNSSPHILDVGCGTGRTAIKIAKLLQNGGHLTGIDVYDKMAIAGNSLERVQKNAKIEGVEDKTTFQYGSAIDIPFDDENFDIVNFSSVLHELHEKGGSNKALDEASRVLKQGGYLFVSEWNRYSLQTIAFLGIFIFVFKPYNFWHTLIKKHGFQDISYVKFGGFGIFSAKKLKN